MRREGGPGAAVIAVVIAPFLRGHREGKRERGKEVEEVEEESEEENDNNNKKRCQLMMIASCSVRGRAGKRQAYLPSSVIGNYLPPSRPSCTMYQALHALQTFSNVE